MKDNRDKEKHTSRDAYFDKYVHMLPIPELSQFLQQTLLIVQLMARRRALNSGTILACIQTRNSFTGTIRPCPLPY
jgi:hypothetical protein